MTRHRTFEIKDVLSIKGLSDRYLGQDYLEENELIAYMDKANADIYVSTIDDQVVGFCSVYFGDESDVLPAIGSKYKHSFQTLKSKAPFLLIKSTAVDESFRGQGIWGGMYQYLQDTTEFKDFTWLSICWKFNDEIPLGPVLEKRGFGRLFEMTNYWMENSLKRGYGCPICGDPPCQCSAVLYVKEN